jgi:amino acid transporter
LAEETEKERIDREVIELLNEIRVTLPGVQVLFGFLLILPFQGAFHALSDVERAVYLLAVLATTAALTCLIAPASYHRLRFRARDKKRMLFISNRLAVAGVFCLAVAIVAALYLIVQVVFGNTLAAVVTTLSHRVGNSGRSAIYVSCARPNRRDSRTLVDCLLTTAS